MCSMCYVFNLKCKDIWRHFQRASERNGIRNERNSIFRVSTLDSIRAMILFCVNLLGRSGSSARAARFLSVALRCICVCWFPASHTGAGEKRSDHALDREGRKTTRRLQQWMIRVDASQGRSEPYSRLVEGLSLEQSCPVVRVAARARRNENGGPCTWLYKRRQWPLSTMLITVTDTRVANCRSLLYVGASRFSRLRCAAACAIAWLIVHRSVIFGDIIKRSDWRKTTSEVL